MKKDITSAAFGILLILAGIFWALVSRPVLMEQGSSELYTAQELEKAAAMVAEEVQSWEGCRLYEVSYAGDEVSLRELDYCQSLRADCEKCMVFEVVYRSPVFNSGAWNPNQTYFWTFYLGWSSGGPWEFVAWGEG